jgi:hypothetical protein
MTEFQLKAKLQLSQSSESGCNHNPLGKVRSVVPQQVQQIGSSGQSIEIEHRFCGSLR